MIKLCGLASIEDTALVSGNHVLDVNEGIFASGLLKELQGLHDQVAQVESLPLVVFYFVACVLVAVPEDIEDRQDLPVIRHQCFSDHVSAQH